MYKTVTLYINTYVHIYTYITLTPPDMFIHACLTKIKCLIFYLISFLQKYIGTTAYITFVSF